MEFIEPCMTPYCLTPKQKKETKFEWPDNVISTRTVVFESGQISRAPTEHRHHVDPKELKLCRQLAREAAEVMAGVSVQSEIDTELYPFYIVTDEDDADLQVIDDVSIRSVFGGSIFPYASIKIESMDRDSDWYCYQADHRGKWEQLIAWFKESPHLSGESFVSIGEYPLPAKIEEKVYAEMDLDIPEFYMGSNLPRLSVGLTQNRSLVGLICYVTHT